MEIKSADDMITAAKWISETYHCAVLCKGGHQLNDANDLLYRNGGYKWFNGKRIHNSNTHGTDVRCPARLHPIWRKAMIWTPRVERQGKSALGYLRRSGPMDHGFDFWEKVRRNAYDNDREDFRGKDWAGGEKALRTAERLLKTQNLSGQNSISTRFVQGFANPSERIKKNSNII